MRRLYGTARRGWEAEIESQGLVYNKTTVPGGETRSYWREDVFYDFTAAQIDHLADVTDQLFAACVEAGDVALADERLLDRMRIPRDAREVIKATWEAEPPSVYGRFDLWWDGEGAVRLLEFNADTPTSLVEAAVVQWAWHLETGQGRDQWNQLDDRLVDAWRRNLSRWEAEHGRRPRVHLAWTDGDRSGEDWMTVAYLADTVQRAGYETVVLTTEELALDTGDARFYDPKGNRIDVLFKLYPWEWLLEDAYGPSVIADLWTPDGTTWIEPIWKMLWSNKGLLPVLWQRYADDPVIGKHLLRAYFADDPRAAELEQTGYARKPLFGREGNNVELFAPGGEPLASLGGKYGAEGWVVQQLCALPDFAGPDGPHHPVLGTWVVDGEAAGLGIRESDGLITDDLSFFVPHTIDHRRPPNTTWSA
ncbi:MULTISPECIES: glutathionylspermidine synthase family protein [unclassified Modestobacter]|uniref:glutathionylspermidine synthase family protein n=1 Tax=unclassified Modestobacter TaxID=2643866 RepID=UPI0022AA0633|nr:MULTISPECIES: glutathionylspermidine synthase family protein [unclassified Modestobacter]MCZ2823281.1 glutathionylspermidine synthase family protein [Modestobacter sp. VKM Ac-2981]MCZ2851526.1 glutathionylspermidine synthase family protein [Modestobacter sp. VKM Ac-2982]